MILIIMVAGNPLTFWTNSTANEGVVFGYFCFPFKALISLDGAAIFSPSFLEIRMLNTPCNSILLAEDVYYRC